MLPARIADRGKATKMIGILIQNENRLVTGQLSEQFVIEELSKAPDRCTLQIDGASRWEFVAIVGIKADCLQTGIDRAR